ncbi:MAG: hypothetical protein GX221_05495 [Candidatus Riflebacteria bacterium]|nr:hypothetical protein [Candidatus Riflebacteria bacterium]
MINMLNKNRKKYFFLLACLFCSFFATGCFLDIDDDLREKIEYKVNENVKNENPDKRFVLENIEDPHIAVVMPPSDKPTKWLVKVDASGATTIKMPLNYHADSYASSLKAVSAFPAEHLRNQKIFNAHSSIRRKLSDPVRLAKLRAAKASQRASVRASIMSSEELGKRYRLNASVNYEILPRTECKLVYKSANLKIFVDKESYSGYEPLPDSLESFVKNVLGPEYDAYMYPILEKYGKIFDADNDGKLSVLITPSIFSYGSDLVGLFDPSLLSSDYNSEPCDIVFLSPPISIVSGDNWKPPISIVSGDNWKQYALVTLIHECQHAVHFSNKGCVGGIYGTGFNKTYYDQEIWLDEGMSVAIEARYRQMRGKAGLPPYSDMQGLGHSLDYSGNNPHVIGWVDNPAGSVYSFQETSSDYGRCGLFLSYIYDRLGEEAISKIAKMPYMGTDAASYEIAAMFGKSNYTPETLEQDFFTAVAVECTPELIDNKAKLPQALKDLCFNNIDDLYLDWLQSVNKYSSFSESALFYVVLPAYEEPVSLEEGESPPLPPDLKFTIENASSVNPAKITFLRITP